MTTKVTSSSVNLHCDVTHSYIALAAIDFVLKVLLDEMYDGMKDSLKALKYDVVTVRDLRNDGENLPDDLGIALYAKDKEMIIVTQNDDMARICRTSDTDVLLVDFSRIAKLVDSELKLKSSHAK